MLASADNQVTIAETVNVAAFFLTNSCTLKTGIHDKDWASTPRNSKLKLEL